MRSLLLPLLAFTAACATIPSRVVPPAPVVTEVITPTPAPLVSHRLTTFGYWLDSGANTNYSSLISIQWWRTDAERSNAIRLFQFARATGRKVILWTPFFSYGPTERSTGGYYLDQSSVNLWNAEAPLISQYLDTVFVFYLSDEMADVAYGDRGNDPYDPNIYNYIAEYASNVIKATFPGTKVALNYGNVPADLVVPKGLDWVALECYYGEYLPKLGVLKQKTNLPLVLMPQAFDDGVTGDAKLVSLVAELYHYSQTDDRVFGLMPFLYCIEASTTCDDSDFYTIGGSRLPLSREAFRSIGSDITGR